MSTIRPGRSPAASRSITCWRSSSSRVLAQGSSSFQARRPPSSGGGRRFLEAMKTLALLWIALVLAGVHPVFAQDPLPSWHDTPSKKAIVDFVAKVTKEGSPDFVPVPARIATFDNDGTLWAEQP